MLLQINLGKKRYQFEVTPIVDSREYLYFLIQLNDGPMMLAQHVIEEGKWLQAGSGHIPASISEAILKKIEKTSVYCLLDKLVTFR